MNDTCCICGREHGGIMQDHHLRPKRYGARTKEVHNPDNIVRIHKVCHQKIHATFSEGDLYNFYSTPFLITHHAEMVKFIKWVQKKPVDFYDKNDDTKGRKSKRRR